MKKATYYDEEYYDTNPQKGYPGVYGWGIVPWHSWAWCIWRTFSQIGARSATDFGCGRGFLLYFLKTYGWDVMGYDWSTYAVQTAAPRVPIEVVDITKPYPYKKADIVICTDVLEHIDYGYKLDAVVTNIKNTALMAIVIHVSDEETKPEHVNIHPREWWENYFRNMGLVRHPLEPVYRMYIKNRIQSAVAKEWYKRAFVLRPVEEKGEPPKTEENTTTDKDDGLSLVSDGAATEQELSL